MLSDEGFFPSLSLDRLVVFWVRAVVTDTVVRPALLQVRLTNGATCQSFKGAFLLTRDKAATKDPALTFVGTTDDFIFSAFADLHKVFVSVTPRVFLYSALYLRS